MIRSLSLPSTRGMPSPAQRLDLVEGSLAKQAEKIEQTFGEGGYWTLVNTAVSYSAKPWDIVLCNPTSAALDVILPNPAKSKLAQVIVKNDTASTNTITVRVFGGGTIDGATTSTIIASRQIKQFISDGKEWKEAASSGGGPLTIQTGTDANVTALANRLIYMPTLTANRTVFAPASPTDGTWFRLLVTNAQSFTVTVDGNGKNIDDRFGSVTSTYVISNDGTLLEFVYIAAAGTWMIL